MEQLQYYNVLVMAQRELDSICEMYKVPHQALVILRRRRGEDMDDQAKSIYREWEQSMESVYGYGFASEIESRIRELLQAVTHGREALRDTNTSSFERRCNELLRSVRVAANDAFHLNEGKQFDFHINSEFRSGERRWHYVCSQDGGVWHGNNRIQRYWVRVAFTPAYLKEVHEHFRFFMNGKNKCWILGTEELSGHMLNDFGFRVFRADAFGFTPDNSEPTDYRLYIVDAPDYLDDDGHILFGHGSTVNGAHNLLKRRIKSETLKRLSI